MDAPANAVADAADRLGQDQPTPVDVTLHDDGRISVSSGKRAQRLVVRRPD
ncbi:MAG: hypothetical protein ABIR54_24070 [Burkholderiaceae bacterium]|jgi:hypothetical protein